MTKTVRKVASPRHEIPGENPEIARLSEMVVTLLGELAIVAERLDTVERLLDQHAVLPRAEIEAFTPDAQAQAERDGKRQRLVRKVFRPLRIAAEREAALATAAPADDAPVRP